MSQIHQSFREHDDVALRIAFDADLAEISPQGPPKLEHLEHLDDLDGPNADAITAASVEAGGSILPLDSPFKAASRFLAVSLQGWSTVQPSRLACGWVTDAPGK